MTEEQEESAPIEERAKDELEQKLPPDFFSGATLLAQARLTGERVTEAPRPEPANTDEAYDYQALVTDALGLTRIGWKVGATNPAAQSAIGAKESFVGPIFSELLFQSGAEIETPPHALRVTEAEFALTLIRDLPPRGAAYGFDEVASAVALVHPAVEIVDKRLVEPAANSANWIIADGGANHAFVLGEGVVPTPGMDLSTHGLSIFINGAKKTEGSGGAVMGNPIMVLAWLATHLSNRGIGLKKGEIISTGLTTPLFACAPGDQVEANFGTLGSLSFTYL